MIDGTDLPHNEKRKEWDRRYREKHREEIRDREKKWREEHKEEIIVYRKIWYQKNKEQIKEKMKSDEKKEYDKLYRINHRDQVNMRKRKWLKKNPEKLRASHRKAKAKRKNMGYIPLCTDIWAKVGIKSSAHHLNDKPGFVILLPLLIHTRIRGRPVDLHRKFAEKWVRKLYGDEFLSKILFQLPDGSTQKVGDVILDQISGTKPINLLES